MKIVNFFLVLLVSLLLLSACSSNHSMNYPFDVRIENTWSIQNDSDIVLSIAEDTLTPSGINYTMQNNSDQTIYFGSTYYIQYRYNGKWYSFIDDADWTLELCQLEAGETCTFDVDWSFLYGKLPTGQYRFIKPCSIQRGIEDVYYAVEFNVT